MAGGETKPFSLGLLEGLGNKLAILNRHLSWNFHVNTSIPLRKLPDVSIPSTSGEEKAAVTDSFVFGQNIEERVVVWSLGNFGNFDIKANYRQISTDKPISEENSKENKSEKSELESKPAGISQDT